MKSYRKEFSFHIPSRRGFVNITPQVEEALRDSGIKERLLLVNHNHITASATVGQVGFAALACVVNFGRTHCLCWQENTCG